MFLVKMRKSLRQRALPSLLESQAAKGDPLIEHGLEGMVTGEADCSALLLALLTRIVFLSNQCSRFIAACMSMAKAGTSFLLPPCATSDNDAQL